MIKLCCYYDANFFSWESARGAVEIGETHFVGVEYKWGDVGLDETIHDASIPAVAVVLAGQTQVFIHFPLFLSDIYSLKTFYIKILKALVFVDGYWTGGF